MKKPRNLLTFTAFFLAGSFVLVAESGLARNTATPIKGALTQESLANHSVARSIVADLRADLRKPPSAQGFGELFKAWENRYGVKAVPHLVAVAKNAKSFSDQERYIAILGIARLGGGAAAQWITPLLSDTSWFIRSAAIKALVIVTDRGSDLGGGAMAPDSENQNPASAVERALKDPALVIRSEAAHALGRVGSLNQIPALLQAVQDPKNYHRGKPQWVPKQALESIALIGRACEVTDCNKEQFHAARRSLELLKGKKGLHAELKSPLSTALLAFKN